MALGKIKCTVTIVVLFCAGNLPAQNNMPFDSSHTVQPVVFFQPKKVKLTSFIVPSLFIVTGALGVSGEFIIPDVKIKNARDRNFKTFHTSLDNYLQFAPMAAGYAALINNHQHRFWKYTEKVAVTEVVVNALVQPIKHITKVPRPDTGSPTSFPSGHTAQAFAGAVIFCDEFAQHNIPLTNFGLCKRNGGRCAARAEQQALGKRCNGGRRFRHGSRQTFRMDSRTAQQKNSFFIHRTILKQHHYA